GPGKPRNGKGGPKNNSGGAQTAPSVALAADDTPEAAQAAGGRVVAFPAGQDASWRDLLMVTAKGGVKRALHNVVTCLELHPAWQGRLRRNDFTEQAEIASPAPWGGEPGE